jgi:16S rRNA (uracil1498-N3)-methyltransferase
LFQSLLIREKFEWVLQKATEVGVVQIVPVLTDRGLVRTKQIEDNKLDRWHRIVMEAAEQSHRGRIPKIEPIIPFADVFTRFVGFDRLLLAAPAQTTTLHEALQGIGRPDASVALLIGPEGGYTEEEEATARAQGAIAVGLGPRILRTETAAIVASALVLYELGEMRS